MNFKIRYFWVSDKCDRAIIIIDKNNNNVIFEVKENNGWELVKKINELLVKL